MKIKGVIFDVDGTLLDSMPVWMNAGERYLNSLGIRAEKDLGEKLFAMSMQDGARYLKEHYGLSETIDQIIEETNNLVKRFYREEAPLKKDVVETLQRLESLGIAMAIATSTDRELIEAAFERLKIKRFFKGIFTCSEVGAGKEKPLIYQLAAKCIGSIESEILVVEDGLHGIYTSRKAGFMTMGVFDEASLKQQEEIKEQADIYGETIRQMLDEIDK